MPVQGSADVTVDTVCDLRSLVDRCMGDASFAGTLLSLFYGKLNDKFQNIAESVTAQRWKEAAAQVHTLKGEAANLGLVTLQQSCLALEDALRTADATATTSRLQALESAADRFREAFPFLQGNLAGRAG